MDGAAKQFSVAYDSGLIPMEFVNNIRKQYKLTLNWHWPQCQVGRYSMNYDVTGFLFKTPSCISDK